MMNNLAKHQLIKPENLDPSDYFRSLIQEACRLDLLTGPELENIQLQTIQLLAKRTERYTGGESSSVKTETAQGILESIFYTIGIYLKNLPETGLSISALKEKPLPELYRHGRKLIELQLEKAKQLFKAVQDNGIATDNHAYNDTLQDGIAMFFSSYDADFAAHDTPASIDYPLAIDKMDLAGVEYIHSYLQKLNWENRFCENFTGRDLHRLLRGYDDNYQDLLVNIFGLVLSNVVGSVLAGGSGHMLNINPSDRQHLQKKLCGLSEDELKARLREASAHIGRKFDVSDELSQQYFAAVVMNMSAGLKHALETNRLESVFISFKENRPQPVMRFEDGRKLDDELFRSVAGEIRECRYVSDKIVIINREIHSITDLVDILEGCCIFGDEFNQLFGSLGDMELALLLHRLPTHVIDADYHIAAGEKEWHDRLNRFLENIDSARREYIRNLSEKIG